MLYYYKERYYDPTYGKFINRDPMAQYHDGMNLYQYVRSRPTVLRDAKGLKSTCCAEWTPLWKVNGYPDKLQCFVAELEKRGLDDPAVIIEREKIKMGVQGTVGAATTHE